VLNVQLFVLPTPSTPTRSLPSLPIDDVLPAILAGLGEQRAVVVQAPPGAGKTTRVPPALLDTTESTGARPGKVIVLEPRRLAARLSARRVAEERGEKPGETVGYEVRFERAISARTRLEFVTEGIFARRWVDDPTLQGVSAVVLDEFHERHLATDVALTLLARLRRGARPDLKIVVMSATLDAAKVAAYLEAPVVTSAGRQFGVEVRFAPTADDRPLESRVVSALRELLNEGVRGDMLVFLPGAAEIRRAMQRAADLVAEANLYAVPLHGDLPPDAQDRALARADRQKIIFSTNVAETSVTIEGIEAVVDSGLARVATYDPWSGRPGLTVAKISRASAVQRAGRAGRLGPGRVVRLYTKGDFETRPEHDTPEILRADLAETALTLRAAGATAPAALPWLDAPPAHAWLGADQLLFRLGAVDHEGRLTDVGQTMAKLGAPPRLSKLMVDAARRGAAWEGCVAAAMLAEGRDVYARGWDDREAHGRADASSDVLVRLWDLEQVASKAAQDRRLDANRARQLGLDPAAAQWVLRGAEQWFRSRVFSGGTRAPAAPDPDEAIRRALLAAFPDRVARRQRSVDQGARLGASRELLLSTGGTALLADSSVVATSQWMVAVEAGDRSEPATKSGAARERRRTRVFLASAIEPDWLIELFPGSVEEVVDVTWSDEHERVEARARWMYDRLMIDERPAGAEADARAAQLLAHKAMAAGLGAFVPDGRLERLRDRLALVLREAPDLAERYELAPLDEASLSSVLRAELAGKRSFAELREGSLEAGIHAAIGHAKLARLDELAPDHITLAGGRRLQVHYEPGQNPWVASRLQDFFGGSPTPSVLAGRVPLVLHLLAPNGRDVQVTTDLAGFWARTYPSVRSELMRRYPRHAWPADPLTAAPPAPRASKR
jgi:ATP-dependent helicase HrpB